MRKINLRQLVFLLIIVGTFYYLWNKRKEEQELKQMENDKTDIRTKPLAYSTLSICFMECYGLSKEEVINVLTYGQIRDSKKTDECQIITLEGRDYKGQLLNIDFSDCTDSAKVMNILNPSLDVSCNCDEN